MGRSTRPRLDGGDGKGGKRPIVYSKASVCGEVVAMIWGREGAESADDVRGGEMVVRAVRGGARGMVEGDGAGHEGRWKAWDVGWG